jgi:hypothetical protein
MDVEQEFERLVADGIIDVKYQAEWLDFLEKFSAAQDSRNGDDLPLHTIRYRSGSAIGPERQNLMQEVDRLAWRLLWDAQQSERYSLILMHASSHVDTAYAGVDSMERRFMRIYTVRCNLRLLDRTLDLMDKDDNDWRSNSE